MSLRSRWFYLMWDCRYYARRLGFRDGGWLIRSLYKMGGE